MFGDIYRDRRVLITGHTGFKGSWLCLWLRNLGALVQGYALAQPSPSHWERLGLSLDEARADLRDSQTIAAFVAERRPEIVFHLAAQPLVRESYNSPRATFDTNVMGTVNLLEACRQCDSVRAVVVVTTDKCYANSGGAQPFREGDPLGGHDPYSASKGAAEIVAASYRDSFFRPGGRVALATARAGNVIGGGDWAADRLIPDLMRAARAGKPALIRSPLAIRPWQHVLEALSGYLRLGQLLLEHGAEYADAWNFGPMEAATYTVEEVVRLAQEAWPRVQHEIGAVDASRPEAPRLTLDCSRARDRLGWHPVWDTPETVRRTVAWYRADFEGAALASPRDLDQYCADAAAAGLEWCQ